MLSHRGKRRPIDPPSIFKVSASSEKFAVSSKNKKSLPSVRNILQDELPAFEENDRYTSFNDLVERIVTFAFPNCELAKVVLESRVKIVAIECVKFPFSVLTLMKISPTRPTIVDHYAG